jgi:hypothetical protein
MANPTTNYGFVLPTPTDLVTDLPADFDVALQGVDTRLKALQPGTTLGDLAYSSATANTNTRLGIGTAGQVLAVSGGVPAWTTTADVTPLTTKGDLFTFTTVDARIGVGANDTVLVADSAQATGLKWAAQNGQTLLSTTSLSGATTTISSISQSYKTLIAVITGLTNATGNGKFRIDINGGATNNFYGGTKFLQGAGVGTYGEGFGYAVAGDANVLRTDAKNALVFTLPNYTVAAIKTWNYYGAFVEAAAGQYSFNSAGYNNDTTATTSLIFSNSGGNLSTGTVKLYGVN